MKAQRVVIVLPVLHFVVVSAAAAWLTIVIVWHEMCERDISWAPNRTRAGRRDNSEVAASCASMLGVEVAVAVAEIPGIVGRG